MFALKDDGSPAARPQKTGKETTLCTCIDVYTDGYDYDLVAI